MRGFLLTLCPIEEHQDLTRLVPSEPATVAPVFWSTTMGDKETLPDAYLPGRFVATSA
jgi:hypothetical protein